MKDDDLDYFKNILNQQLRELARRGDETVEGLLAATINEPDPLDRAAREADRNCTLRLRDRESKLIGRIRQSLEAIEEGTYGVCEACGSDISINRLKARPIARYCIKCKTKMEAFEKVVGL
ncbi:MAG: RNA polymerase-binding protein DksA [Desulfobacterales bacterium]|jgi:DnaK suppressor protein